MFVETLDKRFENVCELDIHNNVDKVRRPAAVVACRARACRQQRPRLMLIFVTQTAAPLLRSQLFQLFICCTAVRITVTGFASLNSLCTTLALQKMFLHSFLNLTNHGGNAQRTELGLAQKRGCHGAWNDTDLYPFRNRGTRISDEFQIPVRYIGVGEGIDDLQVFNKYEFVDSLFGSASTEET